MLVKVLNPMPDTQYVLSRFSHVQLCATLWTVAHQASLSMGFSGKNTGVDCHALLQGIFLTQGSKPHLCLLHWQAGLLPLVPIRKPLKESKFPVSIHVLRVLSLCCDPQFY